jgi:hypothetical protein
MEPILGVKALFGGKVNVYMSEAFQGKLKTGGSTIRPEWKTQVKSCAVHLNQQTNNRDQQSMRWWANIKVMDSLQAKKAVFCGRLCVV